MRSCRGLARLVLIGLALTGLAGVSSCRPQETERHPVPSPPRAGRYMVAAAEPHAVQAGLEMLRRGGSALDAAVAVQMVLTFTEPSESSIGGGGFLLWRDQQGAMTVYDGRETAPGSATPERFLLPGGIRMPFWLAVASGRSVGVPGVVAMLHLAHQRHGRLPWPELFEPAMRLAADGIPMPSRLRRQVWGDPSLWLFPDTRGYLVRQLLADEPFLINPELARTMRTIARHGPAGFYRGELAQEIVAAVNGRRFWPGGMAPEDLARYRAEERAPVCGPYRDWIICGIPPPSAGGLAVLQILGILEHFDLSEVEPNSLAAVHLFAEASRLAYADSLELVGDPAFVEVPGSLLLDRKYLAERAGLIDPIRARSRVAPGMSEQQKAPAVHTTHFSIVDGQGNAVAMTSSIEVSFGSRLMAGGFLLNSQLTDFSFQPARNGRPAANEVEAGKRPRSWMSPTLVLDRQGEIRLILGARGGASIVAHVAKTIVGVLDWNLSLQEAIALPNIVGRGPELLLEEGTVLTELTAELSAAGHRVRHSPLASGVHGIERIGSGWQGGVDPRLAGAAAGE